MSEATIKLIVQFIPLVILLGVLFFLMRRMKGGSSFQSHCREHMAA